MLSDNLLAQLVGITGYYIIFGLVIKMKKVLKTVLIILLSLTFLAAAFFVGIRVFVLIAEKENDKLVEEYENKTIEISDVEKLDNYFTFDDELKTSIKSCKAYFTPTAINFTTIQCYYGSGKLTVTEDYYNKLLNKYDDLKLMSGFPSRNYLGYFEDDLTDRADNDFLKFIRNEEYYYSEKLSDSEGMLILLSQEKGEIYFFINSF